MGNDNWSNKDISAKEYERIHGEKRTPRRIATPAGVAFATKQNTGEYRIWRMDQLLGTMMKHTRPTCWVAKLPDGKHLATDTSMKWCVERLQMASPVSRSITDVATLQYVEQLIRKHGTEEARYMTDGPARKVFEQLIAEASAQGKE